jgi:T4 RnlA family RNA ligase
MTFETTTYNELIELCKNSTTFFFKDFEVDTRTYRIFNYRLASWTEFQKPSAINCRGTMYDITNDPKLVSLPMEKFFNYEEGTVDHTLGKMTIKMEKLDGSLISTYIHNNELKLKSKASLTSDQAIASMKFLALPQNQQFNSELYLLTQMGNVTVNLEYTAPTNRVVVPYQTEDLTIISVRAHTGIDVYGNAAKDMFIANGMNVLATKVVASEPIHMVTDQLKYIDMLRTERVGEGYVIEIVNSDRSYRVKVKNNTYLTLHRTKDSVNNPKRLFEAILDETADDLRSLFADDEYTLNTIADMERKVIPVYNYIVCTVDNFYTQYKNLDRKSFALKAQAEHNKFMGLIMTLYVGQQPDYKGFSKKNMKELFGVNDATVTPNED